MKLRRVILDNWCQFDHLEQELGNGLIGIVGRNGKGKSNILKAIIFACTGWTAQTKDCYVKHGKSNAEVTVEFQTDATGKLYKVVRAVTSTNVVLYENINNSWVQLSNKPAEARELLEELIPISKEFAEYVLDVPQEEMVAIFSETASKRNEILQRIFSFQCLKRCRGKLMDLIRAAKSQRTTLEAQRTLLIDQVSQKRTQIQQFQKVVDKEVLEQELAEIGQRIGYLDTTIGQIQGIEYLQAEYKRLSHRLSEISQARQEPPPENPFPDDSRESMAARNSLLLAKGNTLTQLQNTLKTIQKTPEIALPDSAELDRAFQDLSDAQSKLAVAEQELRKLEACAETGKCPTCGSDIPVSKELLNTAKEARSACLAEVAAMRQRSTELKAKADAACEARIALQGYWETARNYVHELGWRVQKGPDLLNVLIRKTKEEQSKCKGAQEDLAERIRQLDVHNQIYAAWVNRYDILTQQELQLKADLSKIQGNELFGAKLDCNIATLTTEKEQLQVKYNEVKNQYSIRMRYDSILTQLKEYQESLAAIESKLAVMNPELLDNLEYLGNWLLPSEFPRRVCASMYHILTERMNRSLIEFEYPYTVTLKENGEFICQKSDGLIQSANRLSGGEKMILSIAFRLALHDLFLSRDSAGFLMLDEPTTFLDEDNRQALKDVLSKLKKSPRFGGMQIFVVTHDDSLSPLFDYLITL